jgi:hypothetical protein
MTWTAFQWVWRLEGPLFIGKPPAGALNRCRPYVPARVLWGAVTAEISRSGDRKSFPDYGKVGQYIALNCRFTYLFPAEKNSNDFLVWLPKYTPARQDVQNGKGEKKVGLRWQPVRQHTTVSNNNDESVSNRQFKCRLFDSRSGTAIAPESNSASEGSLRETECISPWWRDSYSQGEWSAMLLLGYVFCRNNFQRQLDNINTLFVGGDTRYGLGKISRIKWHEISGDLSVFGNQVQLDGEYPDIRSDIVLGHALEEGASQIQSMQGVKELLGGWQRGSFWQGELAWAPGSSLKDTADWSIHEYGFWMYQGKRQGGGK